MLLLLVFVPLLAAAALAVAPPARAKGIALMGTSAALVLAIYALFVFNWDASASFQLGREFAWLPTLGLSLSFGVDSVALLLVVLTALLGPICVLASATAITERLKTYYGWLLILQAAMTGVFAARDLVFFYICFEFTLIPMYVLISLYGSTNRKKAAIKFFLYTFTGSLIALAGLVYVAWHHAQVRGSWSFDIASLELAARTMSPQVQGWVLLALFAGFAVKVPIFPLHTWLPLAHTEAPTAGSVILAGVLLKLGTYGIYRFALPFCPVAIVEYAPLIAGLSIVGIIYAGLICWVQRDVKRLVAYSSVAHLGFCILGMVALNNTGLTGSVVYMISHGLSTGALFLCIGMIYERYHTRSMDEMGGLAARMPIWATFMVFFTMASVGLPGLNGFVSEFLCLLGAFQADSGWGTDRGVWESDGTTTPGATFGVLGPWYAAVAGVGMIVAAIYLLFMVGKVVFGPLTEPHTHDSHQAPAPGAKPARRDSRALPPDLNPREIILLSPLAVLCVVLGVYPTPMLEGIEAPVSRTVQIVREANRGIRPGRPPATAPDSQHAAADSVSATPTLGEAP